jgi:hypothetical protein
MILRDAEFCIREECKFDGASFEDIVEIHERLCSCFLKSETKPRPTPAGVSTVAAQNKL